MTCRYAYAVAAAATLGECAAAIEAARKAVSLRASDEP